MASPGRPSTYTQEIADEVCARLARGESLTSICRDDHLPHRETVADWAIKDREGFADRYTQARDLGLDVMADEVMEIADDGSNDWMERNTPGNEGWTINGEALGRSRLRFDARRWYLSKLAPKRYGESSAMKVEHSGSIATTAMTEDEIREELAALVAAGVVPDPMKGEDLV